MSVGVPLYFGSLMQSILLQFRGPGPQNSKVRFQVRVNDISRLSPRWNNIPSWGNEQFRVGERKIPSWGTNNSELGNKQFRVGERTIPSWGTNDSELGNEQFQGGEQRSSGFYSEVGLRGVQRI